MTKFITYLVIGLTIVNTIPLFAKNHVFTTKNVCILEGQINQQSVLATITCLNRRGRNYLIINSGGGLTDYGTVLASYLSTRRNKHVIVVNAFSMAAFLLGSVKGKVYAVRGAKYMIHKPRRRFINTILTSEDLIHMAADLEVTEKELITIFTKYTKFTEYKVNNILRMNTDFYFTNELAMKYNITDSLITYKCSSLLKLLYKHTCKAGMRKGR